MIKVGRSQLSNATWRVRRLRRLGREPDEVARIDRSSQLGQRRHRMLRIARSHHPTSTTPLSLAQVPVRKVLLGCGILVLALTLLRQRLAARA